MNSLEREKSYKVVDTISGLSVGEQLNVLGIVYVSVMRTFLGGEPQHRKEALQFVRDHFNELYMRIAEKNGDSESKEKYSC